MSREIEARLKLSAVDRTSAAFKAVSGRMAAVDAKARAITAASARMSAMQAAAVARVTGVLAPVVIGAAAKKIYTDFAEVDRRLTRIGITADASAEAVGEIRPQIVAIALETATPLDAVTSGLEDLVSQGRSLEEALAFLPSVTRTAAASGAEVRDIAATSSALADSLAIVAPRMQSAFDVLVAGGKAGKFELKDMSQYLPSLAPAAAAIGLKGEAGLKRLVAMLQIVRNQTGDASSAATNMQNVFQKMESDETAKKFQKLGIDLRGAMAKARKEGKDLTEVFLDLSEKALKGDLSKIPQLFTDMQVAAGVRALLSQRDALGKMQAALDGVDGSTIADLGKVTSDAKAGIDRLAISFSGLGVEMGKLLQAAGMPALFDTIAAAARSAAAGIDQMNANAAKMGWLDAAVLALAVGPNAESDYAKEQRRQVAESTAKGIRPGFEPVAPYMPNMGIVRDSPRVATAVEARAEMARRYPYPDWAPQPGIPAADLDRLARSGLPQPRPALPGEVGGITPMPRARPSPYEIPVQLDDASLDSEVQRLRARLQSNLDANPLILRARVEPSKSSLDPGRSFSNGNFTGAP